MEIKQMKRPVMQPVEQNATSLNKLWELNSLKSFVIQKQNLLLA